MISGLLISPGSRAPASCSPARACSRSSIRRRCRSPARAALRLARLFEKSTTRAAPNRLAAALTRLGPTYVKLGQFLATRPDVVGVALARDLESLQDKMAPFPQAEAERTIAAAFGKPLAEVFATFGPAVAAASIAQVHRAEVATRKAAAPSP